MIGSVVAKADPHMSVVERAMAGDEVAFGEIVAAHHDDMARIAYLVCGDLDVAEEAEQSAWAVAYRRLRDLRGHDRLRPWLMSIAANEARQIARSRRRRTVRELSVEPARPADVDHAAMIDLAAALGRLTSRPGVISRAHDDVSIGGYEGVLLDLEMDPTWTGGCQANEGFVIGMLRSTVASGPGVALGPNTPVRLLLLDLGAGRTVAIAIDCLQSTQTGAFEDAVAATMPVIESFKFQPTAP